MDKRVELIEQIYKENADKVYRYFYSHTNDQGLAEDLTSKTFMKVLEKFSTYDESKSKAITWLFTIARNTLIDYYRLSSTKNTVSLTSLESDDTGTANDGASMIDSMQGVPVNSKTTTNFGNKEVENFVQQSRNKEILNSAIENLSEDEQLLIFLRYTQELSYEEIAVEIGVNVNAVGVKIHRAVEKLKNILERNGGIIRLDK
jgi:RNA polymerase sigma-70 factor, ECF subfamily